MSLTEPGSGDQPTGAQDANSLSPGVQNARVYPETIIHRLVVSSHGIIGRSLVDGLSYVATASDHGTVAFPTKENRSLSRVGRDGSLNPASIRAYLRTSFPPVVRHSALLPNQSPAENVLTLPDAVVDAMANSVGNMDQELAYRTLCEKKPLLAFASLIMLWNNLGCHLRDRFNYLPPSYKQQALNHAAGASTARLDAGHCLESTMFGGVFGVVFDGEDPAHEVDESRRDFDRINYLYSVCPSTDSSNPLLCDGNAFKLSDDYIRLVLDWQRPFVFDVNNSDEIPLPKDHPRRTCAYIGRSPNSQVPKDPAAKCDNLSLALTDANHVTSQSDKDEILEMPDIEDDESDDNSEDEQASHAERYLGGCRMIYHSAYQREDGRWMLPRPGVPLPYYNSDPDSDDF